MKISKNNKVGLIGKLALGGMFLSYAGVAAAVGATNITPVPVPGPMGLLMLGGAALIIARRFNRNK